MTWVKIGGLVLLIAAIIALGIVDYEQGHKAGVAQTQVAWDKGKAAIAKAAADQLAQVTEQRDAALAANEGITNDLTNQINALQRQSIDLARRLYDYESGAATNSSKVPDPDYQPGAIDPALAQRLGQINDALAATLTECAENRAQYNALLKELVPQLTEN